MDYPPRFYSQANSRLSAARWPQTESSGMYQPEPDMTGQRPTLASPRSSAHQEGRHVKLSHAPQFFHAQQFLGFTEIVSLLISPIQPWKAVFILFADLQDCGAIERVNRICHGPIRYYHGTLAKLRAP